MREIQRQTGFAIGTVRQDLAKLVKLGLLIRRQDGNRVYYAADDRHPLAHDIRQIVLKTAGLADVLQGALAGNAIRCALVFGSVADGTATAASDIDLLVIGEIGLRKLSGLLAGTGDRLGREVNPLVMTPAEFGRRIRAQEHLVTSIAGVPKIFVIGSEHDLAAMG
ncbi:MAG: nucleotidyltransferase domain-containing protein [Planctomycetota bacterium]